MKPLARGRLDWEEDIKPMLETTLNTRDAALIATAWDSGARSGEFCALECRDVTGAGEGMQLAVGGKRGQQLVTLDRAAPYLQRWLEDHPARGDPSAPLWSKLSTSEPISYSMVTKILGQAAEKADVSKRVTLTNIRKSAQQKDR